MNPATDNSSCSEYEARLEDYLSGQLSSKGTDEVEQHLRACRACSAAMEDARATVNLLRLAEPSPGPDPAFPRIVMARIRAELDSLRESKSLWQPFVSLAWRFAATATLGLAVMVTYGVVASHERVARTNTPSVQTTEVRDLFTTDADRVPLNRDDVLVMVAEDNHGKR